MDGMVSQAHLDPNEKLEYQLIIKAFQLQLHQT